jgi:hypothetical protein
MERRQRPVVAGAAETEHPAVLAGQPVAVTSPPGATPEGSPIVAVAPLLLMVSGTGEATTLRWVVSGLPLQFMVMKDKSRCR